MLENKEIIKEKQGFTAVDMLMCLATLVALGFLVVPVVLKKTNGNTQNQALNQAQILSKDLIRRFQQPDLSAGGFARNPASNKGKKLNYEGIIGSDPWGNPFHYRVLKNLYGQPTHLVVWSRGANSVQDTSEYEFQSDAGEVHFSGDDIGYIVSLASSKS